MLRLKPDPAHDPATAAALDLRAVAHQARSEVVTGLLYVQPEANDLHGHLNTVTTPLNRLGEAEPAPGAAVLEQDQRGAALNAPAAGAQVSDSSRAGRARGAAIGDNARFVHTRLPP